MLQPLSCAADHFRFTCENGKYISALVGSLREIATPERARKVYSHRELLLKHLRKCTSQVAGQLMWHRGTQNLLHPTLGIIYSVRGEEYRSLEV
jgi:hypothetical protein